MHWICLFLYWFQVNTANVRTRDASHPLSCIPRSIRLILSALCTLFACTCHFASSSGLERCLSGYLLFCCSSYPLRQLSSKTEMAVRQTLMMILPSPGGCDFSPPAVRFFLSSFPGFPGFFSCRRVKMPQTIVSHRAGSTSTHACRRT